MSGIILHVCLQVWIKLPSPALKPWEDITRNPETSVAPKKICFRQFWGKNIAERNCERRKNVYLSSLCTWSILRCSGCRMVPPGEGGGRGEGGGGCLGGRGWRAGRGRVEGGAGCRGEKGWVGWATGETCTAGRGWGADPGRGASWWGGRAGPSVDYSFRTLCTTSLKTTSPLSTFKRMRKFLQKLCSSMKELIFQIISLNPARFSLKKFTTMCVRVYP